MYDLFNQIVLPMACKGYAAKNFDCLDYQFSSGLSDKVRWPRNRFELKLQKMDGPEAAFLLPVQILESFLREYKC